MSGTAARGVRRTLWCEHALLPEGHRRGVRLGIDAAGRLDRVEVARRQDGDEILPGVTLPGLANTHSHAFHRALRGRTHDAGGTFWTWRERMYHVAARVDPDAYLALARAAYAEMALAGVTAVGEFHYVHHAPGGTPYADPNAMGRALEQAAAEAGVRLTLLDTLYLAGGLDAGGHLPPAPEQRRFTDRDADAWAQRVRALQEREDPQGDMLVGAAAHSVRAVPLDQLGRLTTLLPELGGDGPRLPLHVHVSEQPAENAACLAHHGRTPVRLLADAGLLDEHLTAVHATHLTTQDLHLLGEARAWASFCPTTERDLADGIGPARALREAGARLCLGSDQHAVIDLVEEARALEMHERLASGERGRFTPAQLLEAATGHGSIGRPDAGRLAVGAPADLAVLSLDTVRTAGSDPAQILLTATAADVTTVIRGGETIVAAGRHRLGDVARLLQDAISPLWEDA